MKKVLIIIIAGAVVFYAVRDGLQYYRDFSTQDATPTPTPMPTRLAPVGTVEPVANGNISVSAPAKDTTVSLPFTVTGTARVFENTVSLLIRGEDNSVLYEDFTTAASPDTGQFGPFTKTISHLEKIPSTDKFTLEVFWHSPEDGKPLNVVSIPLIFDRKDARIIKIFYLNNMLDPEMSCTKVFPLERMVARMAAPASAAMELLLKGPTQAERTAGYVSEIPPGTELPRIVITQGTATADFKKDIELNSGGSCHANAIRTQIEQMFYQFPNVSGVKILVEGSAEGLQP